MQSVSKDVKALLRHIARSSIIHPARQRLSFGAFVVLLGLSPAPAQAQGDWLPLPPAAEGVEVAAPASAGPFTIVYPSAARPAAITRRFVPPGKRNPHEGIDLYAPAGTAITAGAPGVVKKVAPVDDALGYGAYVVVTSKRDGITYRITYAGLESIAVVEGETVGVGVTLGQSAGALKLIVQTPKRGMKGFALPHIADPGPLLRLPELRLRPTVNNLRLRAAPSLDAEIVGFVHTWSLLTTPDQHHVALWRTGNGDAWLRIKRDGRILYAAAWYLEAVSKRDPDAKRPRIPLAGMNLDLNHPLGAPAAAPLKNLGWVRMTYNLSYNPANGSYGNTDIVAAYNRYQPVLKRYADNGNKIILVLTHQFYGEGAGYVWEQMNPDSWRGLTARYADLARQVAAQYAGQNIVYAYQIWNEQDTLPGNGRAAVPIPSGDYAHLLSQTIAAIRSVDSRAKIITGGHITGNALGVAYARETLRAMPASLRPDGIAFHPYGVGPQGSPFNLFGTIDDAVRAWSVIMPGTPLWITEWGLLDHQGNDALAAQVRDHALGFLNTLNGSFNGAVAAAVWYAWADSMDNGYGLVNAANQPKEPLYSAYLNNTTRPAFARAAYG